MWYFARIVKSGFRWAVLLLNLSLILSAILHGNGCLIQQADALQLQAYEGLETAKKLREEYMFIPAKVKEVYLFHLLDSLEDLSLRSAIVFVGTCRACALLELMLQELDISCAALHSHKTQSRRLAALNRCIFPLLYLYRYVYLAS